MGYLICEKCGRYYELPEGEFIENILICECGGALNFAESLDEAPVHSFKSLRDLITYRGIIILLIGISCVLVVIVPSIVGFGGNITHFESSWVSFDYPTGWNLEENVINEYDASLTGKSGFNNQFYIDKKVKSYNEDAVLNNLLNSGLNHETIVIDGIDAYKFIKSYDKYGNADIIIYVVKNNIIYNLKFSGNSRDVDETLDVVIKSFHVK
ncbi:MAG TPA: hypothetical protein VK426_01625 [Methanobacterium sp.]|nr:hypothetical protein [Methanobacterium sp.]